MTTIPENTSGANSLWTFRRLYRIFMEQCGQHKDNIVLPTSVQWLRTHKAQLRRQNSLRYNFPPCAVCWRDLTMCSQQYRMSFLQ